VKRWSAEVGPEQGSPASDSGASEVERHPIAVVTGVIDLDVMGNDTCPR
jgi:hypothetical protein